MKIYVSNYLSKSISIISYDNLVLEREIKLNETVYPHHFCIGDDLMYIPSSNNGLLYVVDLLKEKIIDVVSIGGSLSEITLLDEEIYLINEDSNSIYILSKEDLNPIGVIEVEEMPQSLDIDRENKKIYVPCINSIVCIDSMKKKIVNKIDVEFKAWNIKLDELKKQIYISTVEGSVVILDAENMNIVKEMNDFVLPGRVRFNYPKKQIYVSDLGCKGIKIFDYDTLEYIDMIKINSISYAVEVSSCGELLYISDAKQNSIKIYETESYRLVKEIQVGKEPTTIVCV